MKRLIRLTLIFTLLLTLFNPLYAQDKKSIDVLYLQIQQPERPTLSNLDPIPEDLGLKGAELGAKDNNTTGSFLGYQFQL
ncbi:MAG: branched-chain amino acid ABC transporter substrate-binding protein, partial [Thiolinea sp.]